jgi:hypothetical protein
MIFSSLSSAPGAVLEPRLGRGNFTGNTLKLYPLQLPSTI